MKSLLTIIFALGALGLPRAEATFPQAYVYVDVEFKILVPTNPTLSQFNTTQGTQANVAADTMIEEMNQSMDNNWRGLRYRRFGAVQFVTAAAVGDGNGDGINDVDDCFPFPEESDSAWYDRAFVKPFTYAPARPSQWKYRSDVCNFYVRTGSGGGVGAFCCSNTDDNIVVQGYIDSNPGLHEIGHWFALDHTFRDVESNTKLALGNVIPFGGDGIDDTLKDFHQGGYTLNSIADLNYPGNNYANLTPAQQTSVDTGFRNHYAKQFYNVFYSSLNVTQKSVIDAYRTRDLNSNDTFSARNAPLLLDLIANGNFGAPGAPVFFANLSAANQKKVDDLILNIISYHYGKGTVGQGHFSERQSDRMCDIISQTTAGRSRVLARSLGSGKYLYFGGSNTLPANPLGSSDHPHATIAEAQAASNLNNSIIIGRPGSYPVPGPNGTTLTLNKPVTLRATRDGAFTIYGH